MKKPVLISLITVLVCGLVLGGCANAPTAPAPTPTPTPASFVNVTGTWSGPFNSSVTGAGTAIIILQQNGASFNGTFSTSKNSTASVSGTVSGNIVYGKVTMTTPGCNGSFDGAGIVDEPQSNQPTMIFILNGTTTCVGKEIGSGKLQKQR